MVVVVEEEEEHDTIQEMNLMEEVNPVDEVDIVEGMGLVENVDTLEKNATDAVQKELAKEEHQKQWRSFTLKIVNPSDQVPVSKRFLE